MRTQTVDLQNPDGSHRQYLSSAEVQRRCGENGDIYRVSRPKAPKQVYRLRVFANPSKSQDSSASLTFADMETLVGLRKMTQEKRERLEGWGLIAHRIFGTPRAEARAIHFDAPEAMEASAQMA